MHRLRKVYGLCYNSRITPYFGFESRSQQDQESQMYWVCLCGNSQLGHINTMLTLYSTSVVNMLWGRLHVRICVRIGVRFSAKGGLQSNFGSIFSEMCLQTVVMGAW
jgi:hypothetical protein